MSLDKKKKQVELSRVRLAREEMEMKIAEREEEIQRLKSHIEIQRAREQELDKELKGM